MPVRNFTWDDLPALLDFVEVVQSPGRDAPTSGGIDAGGQVGAYGRTPLRRQIFQEILAQPWLAPQENCFLFEASGQLQGFCRVSPELAIGRAVLDLEVGAALRGRSFGFAQDRPGHPHRGAGDQVERQLVRRAVARSRELGARVAHLCLPKDSPSGRLLEEEGFSQARVYWDMLWRPVRALHASPLPQVSLPPGFSIRHFQPGDVQALTDTQNAAFAGSWGFCPNTVEQIEYRSAMSNTRHQGILFLCHGERIAGYCWTIIAPANGQTRGIIDMIGVVPDYRGRGVSRPVLLAAMEYLRSVGVANIGLHTDGSNTPAIRLYVSVGFEKVGELQWYQLRLSQPSAPPPAEGGEDLKAES